MDTDCLFCRIVAGAEPAHLVYSDERSVAFLDHRPLFHGHALVVPRVHHVTLIDLPTTLLDPYFRAVQIVSRAVVEAMDARGSFVAMNNIVSQSVAHLHCHVVPRKPKDGLKGFFWPRTKYESDEQMGRVAAAIRSVAQPGGAS